MSSIIGRLRMKPKPQTKKIFEIDIQKKRETKEKEIIPDDINEKVPDKDDKIEDRDDEDKPKKEPIIKTRIVDKRKIGYDRERLLQRIKQKKLVAPQPKEIEIEQDTERVKKELKEKPKRKKIKKLGKIRLKIKSKPREDIEEVKQPEIDEIKQLKEIEQDVENKIEELETEKKEIEEDIEEKKREDEVQDKEVKPKKKARKIKLVLKRKTKKPDEKVIAEYPETMLDIRKEDRVIDYKPTIVKADGYYLNNREKFINFINTLFFQYREEALEDEQNELNPLNEDEEESKETKPFSHFTHQKIVRDYMNIYTPYRGLLLYHGLGSGKTCSSIAIAEGLKTTKQIIVMTPASLRMNYIEELKKCGDMLYKKNQYWEFVKTNKNEELENALSDILHLKQSYIRKKNGAWLVNMKQPSNFETLTTEEKEDLNSQLNEMIRQKYTFMNYNGLRMSHIDTLSNNNKINPFDNKVIVIDEVHNFISRIVNKLKKPKSLSMRLYEYLLSAKNCRIVMLSGTPIINYPNEIAILFNILRGYIKTWNIPLNIKTERKINDETIKEMFSKYALLDYIDYKPSSKTLVVTRNPFGFINKKTKGTYSGVTIDSRGEVEDSKFERFILNKLKNNNIDVIKTGIRVDLYKALPDNLDDFNNLFIKNNGDMENVNMFKRRILGLTSYFRSAKEKLMPRYDKHKDFHLVKIPMSDYQFGIYEAARQVERKQEKQQAKKQKQSKNDLYNDTVSTYRIFSRLFCNFVFPEDLKRPMPSQDKDIGEAGDGDVMDEDDVDAKNVEERLNNPDGRYTMEDTESIKEELNEYNMKTYETRIKEAFKFLKENEESYLSKDGLEKYSPKFLHMLENIEESMENPQKDGLHLIYSQFRTLEGIGILKLVLEANGFTQFKIKKNESGNWMLDIATEDKGKPTFALYTGTETAEEKEIIRNIFNSDWEYVPNSLTNELREINENNIYGNIIKILMITASGAEGISLKNVRYVHLTEPYWHPVRIEQVIGRARRIGSHQDLPEDKREIEVFLYLMTFTDKQKEGDESIELRLKDTSRIDKKTPLTTDEALNEISNIKEEINQQLLRSIKEASIDCAIHSKSGSKENLVCFSFGKVEGDNYSFTPSYRNQEKDREQGINVKKITWKAATFTLGGKKYKLRLKEDGKTRTDEVYDFDSFEQAKEIPGVKPIYIGKLVIKGKKARIERV